MGRDISGKQACLDAVTTLSTLVPVFLRSLSVYADAGASSSYFFLCGSTYPLGLPESSYFFCMKLFTFVTHFLLM